MRFAGTGGGGVGPSLGEAVLTHDGRGVVVVVDAEGFVVRMCDANDLDASRIFPLELYENEKEGKFVRCMWDCGHESHSLRCFLEKGHQGPHLFKLR